MSQLHRITINPNQWGGRPCTRGLRIRVKDVLEGKVRMKVASRKRRAILRKQLVRRFWGVAGVGGDAAGGGGDRAVGSLGRGDFRCGEPGGIAGAGMTDGKSRRFGWTVATVRAAKRRGEYGWGMKPDAHG